ncbi:MAG: chemotaxis protein CheW [Desulfuromonadales bacterium]|nr:chemotaxis protein CheW [Desulfuromonadales bacterium]
MAESESKKLIFRLGSMGFLLELTTVVGVVEQIADVIDSSCRDIGRGIVSALQFRQTSIPAVDPALKLNIMSAVKLNDKVAVVLRSSEGNWALLVDRVEELTAAKNLQACEFPVLLKNAAADFYSQIQLLDNEPIIVFDPERYYGSDAVTV